MPDEWKDIPIKKTLDRVQYYIDNFDTDPPTRLQMLRMFRVILRYLFRLDRNFKWFADDDAETDV